MKFSNHHYNTCHSLEFLCRRSCTCPPADNCEGREGSAWEIMNLARPKYAEVWFFQGCGPCKKHIYQQHAVEGVPCTVSPTYLEVLVISYVQSPSFPQNLTILVSGDFFVCAKTTPCCQSLWGFFVCRYIASYTRNTEEPPIKDHPKKNNLPCLGPFPIALVHFWGRSVNSAKAKYRQQLLLSSPCDFDAKGSNFLTYAGIGSIKQPYLLLSFKIGPIKRRLQKIL